MCTMEDTIILKKHKCSSTPKPLNMHQDSRIISKTKPKIRIIHIFAPEIIKTDIANFRELVLRLTGKPTEKWKLKAQRKSHKKSKFSQGGSKVREKIKGEEDIWVGANSGGGLLGGFGDLMGSCRSLAIMTMGSHQSDQILIPNLVNSHSLEFF